MALSPLERKLRWREKRRKEREAEEFFNLNLEATIRVLFERFDPREVIRTMLKVGRGR